METKESESTTQMNALRSDRSSRNGENAMADMFSPIEPRESSNVFSPVQPLETSSVRSGSPDLVGSDQKAVPEPEKSFLGSLFSEPAKSSDAKTAEPEKSFLGSVFSEPAKSSDAKTVEPEKSFLGSFSEPAKSSDAKTAEPEKSFLGSLFTKSEPESSEAKPSEKSFLGSLFTKSEPESSEAKPVSRSMFSAKSSDSGSSPDSRSTAQSEAKPSFLASLFSKPASPAVSSEPVPKQSFFGSLFSKPTTPDQTSNNGMLNSIITKPVAQVAMATAWISPSNWLIIFLVGLLLIVLFLQLRPYLTNLTTLIDFIQSFFTGTIGVVSKTSTNVVDSTAEGSTVVVDKLSGAKPKSKIPQPDDSTSSVQTKANYCYVGDWKGVRSCVKADGTCASGKVFSSQSECLYPEQRK